MYRVKDGDKLIAELKEARHHQNLMFLVKLFNLPEYAPDYLDCMWYYHENRN